MAEATQTPSVEQTFNKTDLGHLLYEHRKSFMILVLAVILASIGYVLWNQYQESQGLDVSIKVFDFQTKSWSSAKEGKIQPNELVVAFNGLPKEVQSAAIMVPVGLEMGKFLYEKGALLEAEALLSKLNVSHPVSLFFVNSQRAVILEQLSRVPEAIAVLEKVAQVKDGLMLAKVNIELGRLNLANGEKGKAQTHFEYVLSTFPNDEQAKLAKLYMAKIAQ